MLEKTMKTKRGNVATKVGCVNGITFYDVQGTKSESVIRVNSQACDPQTGRRRLWTIEEYDRGEQVVNSSNIKEGEVYYFIDSKRDPEIFQYKYIGKKKVYDNTMHYFVGPDGEEFKRKNTTRIFNRDQLVSYVESLDKQLTSMGL